jgi:adenylyltransferase/sulfurtransferase
LEPKELKALLDRGEKVVLVDVREPQEWALVRLEGARHIPLREVPARLADLDRAALTVVYCHHGMRSASACGFLHQHGFTRVHNLEGGIDAWVREIEPDKPRY